MRKGLTLLAIASLGLLPACGPGASKSDQGLVSGAVIGGIVGNSVGRGGGRAGATIVGAVIGGIIGGEIGRKMDRQDRIIAQQAELRALEEGRTGVAVVWRNPDNGRYGEIIPGATFRRGPLDCRDYTHRVYIDGRPAILRGTACRNPDGTWSAVS